MRIKQIELNGFKSFMARTALELPLGVTAIVGPNGCGKSNVVDAIRWVLGEQSPKHLRGGTMEDVIFAGNADHAPLGMAEVSLLLERTEDDLRAAAAERVEDAAPGLDALPPELAHASEVLVTRRYFRSGESEYLINRQPCRLKDITELFLGTGVGTKAYAIIEQGRVEQLVNAKPDDMRLFIEEAAGTTRFRARRVAAERKLERTRENLVRVLDIVHELERQMASLQRQAKRAEEYHRIKGELRDLDLRVMAARQRAWRLEMASLGDRVGTLQAEEAGLHEQLRETQQAADEARLRRHEREQRLREVSGEIAQERLRAGEAGTRHESLVGRAAELERRATEAAHEGGRLRARLGTLAAELAGLGAAVDRLGEEHAGAEAARNAAEARLAELAAAGAPLERAVEESKDAVVAAVGDEARLRNLGEALRRRRDEIEGQRQQLAEEQQALGARLETNGRERELVRERTAALEGERRALDEERGQLGERGRALAADEGEAARVWEATRGELTQLASRAESLRQLQARYEGCTRGTATLLERGTEGAALLASVLRVPAALERAVAAALGVRLGYVLLPDTAAGIEAVRWLRDGGGGSATVVPRVPGREIPRGAPAERRLLDAIEVDPEHRALAEALMGSVRLADDLDDAVRAWREAPVALTVVTPAGEAIDPLGAVSGGSEPPLEETLLARARELRELDEAAAETAARAEAQQLAVATLRERIAEVAALARAADERLQALRLDLVAAQKDRERLEEERARISAELEVGALEASGLAGADGQVAGELASLEDALAVAASALSARRTDLVGRQGALADWRAAHADAEAGRTDAAVWAASIGERRRAAEADAARMRASAAEVEERASAAERVAAESSAGARAAAEEAERTAAVRAEAEAAAAALGVERERLVAEIADADATLSADDLLQRSVHERLEAARGERGEHEVGLAERRMALEQLAERLAERYDLGPEALDDIELPNGAPGEGDATRAEDLRTRLVRLGDVNPAAVAELAEVRGRYDFLAGQRADLENSLEDLRQTIAKLMRTSRQRFEETFAAANEKLAEVFPKLFPGGKARLALVPAEDGGDPGVEIVVQPVGKKLQSLSLLSGGEKALTATALVFSLFLIRPTPFCLLDEVDAPLDEANIGRFNQIVADMAGRTQFMLITHNRRTMEVAETLYGITMEHPGVSKVVSVRLNEAA